MLPWRKPKPTNPWGDEDPLLSGWVPGLTPQLDLFALLVSCMRSQAQLAEAVQRLNWLWVSMCVLWVLVSVLWALSSARTLGLW